MQKDKNTLRGEAVIFAALPSLEPVMAADCREATDPGRAPLKVRDTHENITGIIGNGCVVQLLREGSDDAGKPWAYVATLDGHPIGWVYREFISFY